MTELREILQRECVHDGQMSSRSQNQVKWRDMPSFYFFLFHSGKSALFSAVLSFHLPTAPDKSKELKSEEHF